MGTVVLIFRLLEQRLCPLLYFRKDVSGIPLYGRVTGRFQSFILRRSSVLSPDEHHHGRLILLRESESPMWGAMGLTGTRRPGVGVLHRVDGRPKSLMPFTLLPGLRSPICHTLWNFKRNTQGSIVSTRNVCPVTLGPRL